MAVRRIKFIKRREVYIMRLHDGYQSNSSKEKQAVCDSCHEIGGAFAENKRPYFIIDPVGRSGTRACYHTEGVFAENVHRL